MDCGQTDADFLSGAAIRKWKDADGGQSELDYWVRGKSVWIGVGASAVHRRRENDDMTIEHVCARCFEDENLAAWIGAVDGEPGCDFCDGDDAPTCDIDDLCRHMEASLREVYGFAVEQLPWESAEGGYIGRQWSTYEILVEEVGLSLPRDQKDHLFQAVLGRLPDEIWCDYDWLSLDMDDALRSSWEQLCETVKHKRRFFFHAVGEDTHDSFTPATLLKTIANISDRMGLIGDIPPNTGLWRARTDIKRGAQAKASDFGPPPEQYATQSNRMNPPGIPMLYLASTAGTALRETKITEGRVGRWVAARALRVLDLRTLKPVPGIFTGRDRDERLALSFLHDFRHDIMQPVERDAAHHVEYLPSQVVTEYLRDYEFEGGKLDGIAYGSTVHKGGWNVALFLSRSDLGLEEPGWKEPEDSSMIFAAARWAKLVRRTAT
jgi:RES domain-containing protein